MVKMSGLQIRKPISEKLKWQIYKNNQNKNYSLYSQGIHSKDLIKMKRAKHSKPWVMLPSGQGHLWQPDTWKDPLTWK